MVLEIPPAVPLFIIIPKPAAASVMPTAPRKFVLQVVLPARPVRHREAVGLEL